MTKALIRALIACATIVVCSSAFADSLADVAHAQSRIGTSQQVQARAKAASERLKNEADQIAIEIMQRFYAKASKAGIKFEQVDLAPNPSSGDNSAIWTVDQSRDGGRFVIARSFFASAGRPTAWVSVQGGGLTSVSVYFDITNDRNGMGICDASLQCTCRVGGANLGDYSMPCSEFFDPRNRAAMEDKLVDEMSAQYAAYMKHRAAKAAE